MATVPTYLLLATTTIAGMVAGLFYSWSCGITQGLGKLSDLQYLQAMQSINREIQRPVFLLLFIGLVLLLPLCAWQSFRHHHHTSLMFLAVASVTYIGGVFLVTIAGNVPLNEMLDKTVLDDRSTDLIAQTRIAFEAKWNSLNVVRTIFAIISFVCSIIALKSLKS